MIRAELDADHKRVVIRDQSRILGELIYQLQTVAGWCDAVTFHQVDNQVTVALRGSGANPDSAQITDSFHADGNSVTVRRTWRFLTGGRYGLRFDYRLRSSSESVLLPSFLSARTEEHVLRTPVLVDARRLAAPLVLFHGDLSQAIAQRGPVEAGLDADYECYLSEGHPALTVRMPVGEPEAGRPGFVTVGRREAPLECTALFRIVADGGHPIGLLREALGWVWDPRTADQHSPVVLGAYVGRRQAYLDAHLVTFRGSTAGVRPASDGRGGGPGEILAGVAPYWGLEAARAIVFAAERTGHPERLLAASDIAEFYCNGLRPDGSYCDAFDLSAGKWGTVPPGSTSVVPGLTRLPHAAEAGLRLIWLYDQLRKKGVEAPRLARTATEIAHYFVNRQANDGSYAAGWEGTAVVSLLCALERLRGRNSLRVASLKRAAPHLSSLESCPEQALVMAGSLGDSLAVLRAALDLLEVREDRRMALVADRAGASVMSWVYSRDLSFPAHSDADRRRISSAGLPVVSADGVHLGFGGHPAAHQLFRLSRLRSDPFAAEVARRMVRACAQCAGGSDPPAVGRRSAGPPRPWDHAAALEFVDGPSGGARGRQVGKLSGSRIGQVSLSLAALADIAREFPQEVLLETIP